MTGLPDLAVLVVATVTPGSSPGIAVALVLRADRARWNLAQTGSPTAAFCCLVLALASERTS